MSRGYSSRTFGRGRVILAAVEDPQNLYLPGGVQLDPAARYQGDTVIPAGTPLYRDGTSGLYLPWKGTQANGAGTTSATLIVDDASLFNEGDAIRVGSTTTTVDAVNYETNTITLAATATWTDNSAVGPSSGYAAATLVVGLLSDEFGVDVAAEDGELTGRLLLRGRVKADLVINRDALVTSMLAGEQKLLKELQLWRGDYRLA